MDAELYRLSPFIPSYSFATSVTLNDCTLREGEQSSDAAFSDEDRRRIASALASSGIGRVQVSLRGDADANQEVFAAAHGAETEVLILGFLANWREQIDFAVRCGTSHLNIINRVSPPLLQLMGRSIDDVVAETQAALRYASKFDVGVIFSPGDTMRAEWETLERLYAIALEEGADAVYILDTVGVATPAAVSEVVGRVANLTNGPIGIHAHDDLGLGLANALAAFEAGATLIDTCVNGMGDRCGNPATDEVAVALELIYGQPSGVNLESLSALAALVAETSGVPIPPNKPLVGRNASTHKLDIHVKAVLEDPLAFQPMRPELVGNRATIAVGRNSGPITLAAKLAELGLEPLDAAETAVALELVDTYAERHKRSVPDDELERIANVARA